MIPTSSRPSTKNTVVGLVIFSLVALGITICRLCAADDSKPIRTASEQVQRPDPVGRTLHIYSGPRGLSTDVKVLQFLQACDSGFLDKLSETTKEKELMLLGRIMRRSAAPSNATTTFLAKASILSMATKNLDIDTTAGLRRFLVRATDDKTAGGARDGIVLFIAWSEGQESTVIVLSNPVTSTADKRAQAFFEALIANIRSTE